MSGAKIGWGLDVQSIARQGEVNGKRFVPRFVLLKRGDVPCQIGHTCPVNELALRPVRPTTARPRAKLSGISWSASWQCFGRMTR
jgi:hypothetical protein